MTDEWYNHIYLAVMFGLLESAELAGEKQARYFNVKSRRWFTPDNQLHASLCRTAFRRSFLPDLVKACEESKRDGDVFVDLRLWGMKGERKPKDTLLLPWAGLSVGIKGMPGRGGAGGSHKVLAFPNKDPQLIMLKKWIGEKDASDYAGFEDMNLVRQ